MGRSTLTREQIACTHCVNKQPTTFSNNVSIFVPNSTSVCFVESWKQVIFKRQVPESTIFCSTDIYPLLIKTESSLLNVNYNAGSKPTHIKNVQRLSLVLNHSNCVTLYFLLKTLIFKSKLNESYTHSFPISVFLSCWGSSRHMEELSQSNRWLSLATPISSKIPTHCDHHQIVKHRFFFHCQM